MVKFLVSIAKAAFVYFPIADIYVFAKVHVKIFDLHEYLPVVKAALTTV